MTLITITGGAGGGGSGVGPQGPQGPQGIPGPSGATGAPGASGASFIPPVAKIDFSVASGSEFVVYHGFNNLDFLSQVYKTDVSPRQLVLPNNVAPSGLNHAIVSLDIAMEGRLLLISV